MAVIVGGLFEKVKQLRAQVASLSREVDEARRDCQYWKEKWHEDFSDQVPFTKIINTVARRTGISRFDILSARKNRNIVRARHLVMALSRKLTSASYPQIGRYLGGRDHTTILHGAQKIERLMESDPRTFIEMSSLIKELTESNANAA